MKVFKKYQTTLLIISYFLTMAGFVVFVINLPGVKSLVKNFTLTTKIKPICKNCNIIFVAVDTLSAEHLPCYGYHRNTAKNLCAFAEKNIIFENAFANSFWTLPSDLSVLTGLWPYKTKVMKGTDKLDSDVVLLPQLLRINGYNPLFFAPKNDIAFPTEGVYDRLGSDFYNENNFTWKNSIETFKRSVGEGKKTFLYLHSYATHAPYIFGDEKQIYEPVNTKLPTTWKEFANDFEITPEIADRVVADAKVGIAANKAWEQNEKEAKKYINLLLAAGPEYKKQKVVLEEMRDQGLLWYQNVGAQKYEKLIDQYNQNDVDTLRALYDQTIYTLDRDQIPLLTNLIYDPKFRDNTIVVIYSEHGQEFMEHGHLYHQTMYNPNTKVPLIMYIPGIHGKKIEKTVQLADIFPTVLDLISIKIADNIDGRSLVGSILGGDEENYIIQIDGAKFESKVLVYGQWKMFLSLQKDGTFLPYELYNLRDDPGEKNNLIFTKPEVKEKIMKDFLAQLNKK